MTITMKKTAVLDALNKKLAEAEAYDAEQSHKHAADEAAALKRFRVGLKGAMAWDWATVKKNYYRVELQDGAPSCPRRSTHGILHAIQMVKMASADRFSVRSGTDLHAAMFWARPDKKHSATLCD